jgi:hypothetical protein
MITQHYLDDVVVQFRKLKTMGDKALAQVSNEQLFSTLDPESNSLGLIMKHMSGNMRSRWTDFLTTDGEKPDRHRDTEFERETSDTRDQLLSRWEQGWSLVFNAVSALTPADLDKTITIRGESHTVVEALNRQVSHYAQHVGQIVFLARHLAGPKWQTLSIPRGKSKDFEVEKTGKLRTV